jgi:hypothetical protein
MRHIGWLAPVCMGCCNIASGWYQKLSTVKMKDTLSHGCSGASLFWKFHMYIYILCNLLYVPKNLNSEIYVMGGARSVQDVLYICIYTHTAQTYWKTSLVWSSPNIFQPSPAAPGRWGAAMKTPAWRGSLFRVRSKFTSKSRPAGMVPTT